MSTLTEKFNLIKPEKTDPADITSTNANWDKVDERLGQCYMRSYTALSQFGLSDNEMSPTDLASNIDRIVTTLDGNAATLMFVIQPEDHPNLHLSVIEKLNADTNITFSADTHVGWLYIRFSGEAFRPVLVETNLETANYYDSIWTCVYNKGADGNRMSTFKTVADITPGGISVIPISSGGTGATDAKTARKNLGAASIDTFTATVDANSWTNDRTNGGYYQTVNVPGVLETDDPIVDVLLGSKVSDNTKHLTAWDCVTRITTANDSVTLYANVNKPSDTFTIRLKAVR